MHRRTLKRSFFNLSAIVSLLLGSAIALMWVRSSTGDCWQRYGRRQVTLATFRGYLIIRRETQSMNGGADVAYADPACWLYRVCPAGYWEPVLPAQTDWGFGKNEWFADEQEYLTNGSSAAWVSVHHQGKLDMVSLAYPLCASLLLPLLRILVWLRQLRVMRKLFEVGKCTNCGYDLRASPLRCPECGTFRS